jgi:hypothetical protein
MPLRRDPSNRKIFMTKCPACGAELDRSDISTSQHFVDDHSPEDFGLAPLGVIDREYLPQRRRVSEGVEKQSSLATFQGGAP